ncbi:RNA polymerase subunit sigma-70 [bacterium 1xD8-48]|nr:RNA polymerase subunit sigma-70 [bacterium 1xD8-48]
MDKKILSDYIDACELVKETEYDISRMRKIEMEHAQVVGSNPDFPYQKMSFHVSGVTEIYFDAESVKKEKNLLIERKQRAENLKSEIEKWMNTIPARMQRIIRLKYFEGKLWKEIAAQMGRNATADSVRMEFERFLSKK